MTGAASTDAPAVKGGDKVVHCGGGIVYHRHDGKEPNWEPGGVRSGVVRIIRDLGDSGLPATLEPVALAVHFQDVDVVGEAVQQGPGQSLRTEDLGPLVEGKVGGHED